MTGVFKKRQWLVYMLRCAVSRKAYVGKTYEKSGRIRGHMRVDAH